MSSDECPSCHAKLDKGASYCPKCGKQLQVIYKKSGDLKDVFVNPSLLISEVDEKVEQLQEEVKRINSKLDKILEKLEKHSG